MTDGLEGRYGSYWLRRGPLEFPAGRARIYEIDGHPDLYYKEFGEPRRGATELRRLGELVDTGHELAAARTSPSMERIAWPRDLIEKNQAAVGVVIPYAGDRFYRESRGEMRMPRALGYLRRPEDGVPVELRLTLMRQLAGVLALLEHANLVHGDISAQNVLWCPPPRPSIMLIDCDGMHDASIEGAPETTEGWADPRQEHGAIAAHDMCSDWFALALAIWRVAMQSRGAPEVDGGRVKTGQLPRQLAALVERAFADPLDPGPRPCPQEWINALNSVLASQSARRRIERSAARRTLTEPRRGSANVRRRPAADAPTPAAAPAAPVSAPYRHFSAKRILVLPALLAMVLVLGVSFLGKHTGGGVGRAEAAVASLARALLRVRGTSATCPADSSFDPGTHYLCRVETRGGAVGRVRVQVGAGGGARRGLHLIAYRRRAVLRDIRARYRHLRPRLGYGLRRASCPRTFSARPGTTFICPAAFTDGAHGKIAVHLHSRRGRFSWHEVGAGIGGRASALH